jgi:hypothetical protein
MRVKKLQQNLPLEDLQNRHLHPLQSQDLADREERWRAETNRRLLHPPKLRNPKRMTMKRKAIIKRLQRAILSLLPAVPSKFVSFSSGGFPPLLFCNIGISKEGKVDRIEKKVAYDAAFDPLCVLIDRAVHNARCKNQREKGDVLHPVEVQ